MRIILTSEREGWSEAEGIVGQFLSGIRARGLSGDLLYGARMEGTAVTGIMAVESPGRVTLLFLPPESNTARHRDVLVEVLRTSVDAAWSRRAVLVQSLVEAQEAARVSTLQMGGLEFLASLVFCEREASLPEPEHGGGRALEVTFLDYVEAGDAVFGPTLAATYQATQDCPRLSGVRDIEDILASHRSCGIHDPTLWFVAWVGSRPAGLILLSPVIGNPSLEVVYMGVVPHFRGRGIGDALLRQAQRCCVARSLDRLILAVDRANVPALALYDRWGFQRLEERHAWIAVASGAQVPARSSSGG